MQKEIKSSKKPLIIAEKPSAARAYAEALGGFQKKNGYLESDTYYLAWAVGHLIGLAMPEVYDQKLKSWKLDMLPFIPESFKLTVLEKTKGQLLIIKQLAEQADEVIIATDAGREGQLIAQLILQHLQITLPTKRLWISSLTKEAIVDGFSHLQPGSDYENLYQAALCRAQGDYLIGINMSRAFSVKYSSKLSLGRVQTPVLKLLVTRQQEIDDFQPEAFWELEASFSAGYRGKWFYKKKDRFEKKEAAEVILAKVSGQKGLIKKMDKKESREKPPLPFDLTTLQREANRLFGYTAQQTLDLAQALYEGKLISYPRTDSRYFTKDLVKILPQIGQQLQSYFACQMKCPITTTHRAVDDKKVTDHHAIIPTKELPNPSLADEQKNIYQLIGRRFFVQFYEDAVYQELALVTEVAEEQFKTNAKVLAVKGWREVEGNKEIAELPKALAVLKKGEDVLCESGEILEKMTTPPKLYTEATLLGSMERPKLKEGETIDTEMLDLLKEHGLGTPATRASIIEKLKQVGYIEAKGKTLLPTTKGIELIRVVEEVGSEVLASPEMTGEWEKKVNDIYKDAFSPEQFMTEIKALTEELVEKVKLGSAGIVTEALKEGELRCFCGNKVVPFANHWSCLGYKDGSCKFAVSKVLAGKKITEKQVMALLEKQETGLIKGFVAKSGKKFDSKLVVRDGRVEFGFTTGRNLVCPLCGKPLREFLKSWSCTGYQEGCQFTLWKEICGRKLLPEEMETLLTKGELLGLQGFTSKQGKDFSAGLILAEGRVQFDFSKKSKTPESS